MEKVYKLFEKQLETYTSRVDAGIEAIEPAEIELPHDRVVRGYSVGEFGRNRFLTVVREESIPKSGTVVVINAPIGYRGDNEIKFDSCLYRVLGKGKIAQGDAGRMGEGEQMIIWIPQGDKVCITVNVGGRRYGLPTHYKFGCVGGEPPVFRSDGQYDVI